MLRCSGMYETCNAVHGVSSMKHTHSLVYQGAKRSSLWHLQLERSHSTFAVNPPVCTNGVLKTYHIGVLTISNFPVGSVSIFKISNTLQSMKIVKLSQQRFWPGHEGRLIKTIPRIKTFPSHCTFSLIPHLYVRFILIQSISYL